MNSPPILEPILVGLVDVHWGLTDLAVDFDGQVGAGSNVTAFSFIFVEYVKNIYGWSDSAPPGGRKGAHRAGRPAHLGGMWDVGGFYAGDRKLRDTWGDLAGKRKKRYDAFTKGTVNKVKRGRSQGRLIKPYTGELCGCSAGISLIP